MTLSIAAAQAEFAPAGTYLDTASVGLLPARTVVALRSDLARLVAGRADVPGYDAPVADARARWARLAGVPVEWVAIGSQVSALAGIVAAALPAGAEVLCADGDFTSVLFPFLAQADRGVRIRSVPLGRLAEAVGPGTTLVAVSAVQSADGAVADLDAIVEAAGPCGAATFLDVTQACGWLAFDGVRFDYVAGAAYKWQMTPRGAAFLAVRPERLAALRPHGAGWYAGEDPWTSIYGAPLRLAHGSRRLDVSPAWASWVGAAESLALLEAVGLAAIGAHDVGLADGLLEALGLEPRGSAICSLDADADAVERLGAAGVKVSRRDGRLRVSFHLHNTWDDVERVAALLRR